MGQSWHSGHLGPDHSCCGAVLCIIEYLSVSLTSLNWMPVASLPIPCYDSLKIVYRRWQMSLEEKALPSPFEPPIFVIHGLYQWLALAFIWKMSIGWLNKKLELVSLRMYRHPLFPQGIGSRTLYIWKSTGAQVSPLHIMAYFPITYAIILHILNHTWHNLNVIEIVDTL